MIKIEVLFSEVCNLYGDIFNIKYLAKCIKDVECVYTDISEEPKFVKEDVNMIYLAPMPEKIQEIVIEKLLPYKERIKELIEKNVIFLLTGNAVEIFGNYIENEDGSKIKGLGILDLYAKRQIMNRYNGILLGKYKDIDVLGYKSQFTMAYSNNKENFFIDVEKGIGLNKESKLEGIRVKNLIGTYILGPILILNPLLTKEILKMLGCENTNIALEEEVIAAYKQRLEEFRNLK